jgi:PAS domain S-box-containing protein
MFSRKLKLLFVGDSEGLARIRRLLVETDFQQFSIEGVSPDEPTLKTCWLNIYDVCLIDAEDGPRLVTESKRVGFTVPMIMITSNSAIEVLSAFRAGVLDCLVRDDLTGARFEQSVCWVIESARNQESLAQHERCYLSLVENTGDIIFTHDLKGNCTFINRTGEELTGYTLNEIVSLNLSQVLAADYLTPVWRTIMRMLNDHRRATYNAVMLTKHGHRLPLAVSTHLIYRDGIPIGVQALARSLALQGSFSSVWMDDYREVR